MSQVISMPDEINFENLDEKYIITIPATPIYNHEDPFYNENGVGVYGLSGYQIERGESRKDLDVYLSKGIPKGSLIFIIKTAHSGLAYRNIEAIGKVALRIIDDDFIQYHEELSQHNEKIKFRMDYDFKRSQIESILAKKKTVDDLSFKSNINSATLKKCIESTVSTDAWKNRDQYIIIFEIVAKPKKMILIPPEPPLGKNKIRYQAGYYRPIRVFARQEIKSLVKYLP